MSIVLSEPILPDELDGQPITYRSDRITLEYQAFYDWMYRELWSNINNDGFLWLMYMVFLPAILSGSWVILQFYGMSNSGKSWLAIAKAFLLKQLLEFAGYDDVVIEFAQNWSVALELLTRLKKGDIIICDEESDLSGEEADVEAQAMSNVLRSSRILGINIFFVDPSPKQKDNVDAYIRVAGKLEQSFTTMSIVYGPEEKLVGLDFTEIPVEDESFIALMPDYIKAKTANVYDLIASRGRVRADLSEGQLADAKRLFLYALEKEGNGVKITRKRLETWADDVTPPITGSVKYCDKVVTRVWTMVDEFKGHVPSVSQKDSDFNIVWTASYQRKGDKQIKEDFLSHVIEYIRSKSSEIGLDTKKIDVFSDWLVEGMSQKQLSRKHEIATGTVSNWLADCKEKIGQSVTGYAVEYAVSKAHPTWVWGGMNDPLPDFLDHETKTVYSVKGMIREEGWRTFTWSDLAKEERRLVVEEGWVLKMLTYNLHPSKMVFRVYDWTFETEAKDDV